MKNKLISKTAALQRLFYIVRHIGHTIKYENKGGSSKWQ